MAAGGAAGDGSEFGSWESRVYVPRLVIAQLLAVIEASVVAVVVVDEVTGERGVGTDDPPAGELGGAVDGREWWEPAANVDQHRLAGGSVPRVGGNVVIEFDMPTRHGDRRYRATTRLARPFLSR